MIRAKLIPQRFVERPEFKINGSTYRGASVVVDDAGVLAIDGQTQPGLVPRPVTLLTRCEVEHLEIHGQDAVGDGPTRLLRAMRGLPHD